MKATRTGSAVGFAERPQMKWRGHICDFQTALGRGEDSEVELYLLMPSDIGLPLDFCFLSSCFGCTAHLSGS